MTEAWTTIGALVLLTATTKAAGPMLVGGRQLPRAADAVIAQLAPALLAALVLTETFAVADGLAIDARAAGLACAGVAVSLRAPIIVTVLVAAAGAAAARAIS